MLRRMSRANAGKSRGVDARLPLSTTLLWMAVAFLPVAVLGVLLFRYAVPSLGGDQTVRAVSIGFTVVFALVLSILGYLLSRREAVGRMRLNALHADRQEQLFKLTVSLKDARDETDVADAIVDGATQILMAERGSFSLLRDGRAKLVALKSYQAPLETPVSGEFVIDVDTGVIGDAVHTGASLRLQNPDSKRVPLDKALKQETRDIIVVPVFNEDTAVGAIEVSNPMHGGTFAETDAEMLEHIARAAGMAMGVVMSREIGNEHHERLLELLSETLENTVVWPGHNKRVAHLCLETARRVRVHGEDLDALRIAAQLHDIGMTLEGGGPAHPVEGARMVATLGFAQAVGRIIGTHHERVDGSGFPLGLTMNDLPLTSRVLAVVEEFESLTNPKSPTFAFPASEFPKRAASNRGLDQRVVKALCQVLEAEGEIRGIGS